MSKVAPGCTVWPASVAASQRTGRSEQDEKIRATTTATRTKPGMDAIKQTFAQSHAGNVSAGMERAIGRIIAMKRDRQVGFSVDEEIHRRETSGRHVTIKSARRAQPEQHLYCEPRFL
ncbi:MAG TPA: hypothetical protein VGZ31_05360 [Chthoniobacterales bacterium]|nr:hypothetical protein [Chthoniobacterales bacterium]